MKLVVLGVVRPLSACSRDTNFVGKIKAPRAGVTVLYDRENKAATQYFGMENGEIKKSNFNENDGIVRVAILRIAGTSVAT